MNKMRLFELGMQLELVTMLGFIFIALLGIVFHDVPILIRYKIIGCGTVCILIGWMIDYWHLKKIYKQSLKGDF